MHGFRYPRTAHLWTPPAVLYRVRERRRTRVPTDAELEIEFGDVIRLLRIVRREFASRPGVPLIVRRRPPVPLTDRRPRDARCRLVPMSTTSERRFYR